MGSCAVVGGCPSDYIAISVAALSFILLVYRSILPFIVHRLPRANGSAFWLPIVQLFASFFLLLSLVISMNYLKLNKKHRWLSCYVWAVWFEGPLGFGLLLCCRISQAFHLFFIFVKRRLPPIRSFIFLPLILSPWIAAALFIHLSKPLNHRCHMGTHWIIVVVCLHASYIAVLVGFTGAIRHVEFRFHEVKDLWQGILVSALVIGIWVTAYVLNEVHDDVPWLQVVSRFFLLFAASILVLAFFSISSLQPLLSQISLRKRQLRQFQTMGQALGIPDSGLLVQLDPTLVIDPKEPLDKLLLNRKFRQSFMAFADSCLAGEGVRFYNEVHELRKIPLDDSVRRIYMARHIIETYIVAGAAMEVNISHRTRQNILSTPNLAHPELFNTALYEVLQLMRTNLVKDYWSSMFFIKFKEETGMRSNGHELEQMGGWNFSPRLSTMQNIDDPFHHELALKSSSSEDNDQRTL